MPDRAADHAMEEAILAYLQEHPGAMDSLDAIAEWWVMRRVVRTEVEAVEHALEGLVRAGLVDVVSVGGQTHYRLRRR